PQDSVELVELGMGDMINAIMNGTVDAAYINEPLQTVGMSQGLKIVASPFLDLQYPANLSIYITTDQFASENPAAVEGFGRAMNRALAYAQDHPDEARAMALTYTTVTEEVVAQVMLPYWTPEIGLDSVREQAELTVKFGGL